MLKNRKQFAESKRILTKIEPLAIKYEHYELLVKIKHEKLEIAETFGIINKEIDVNYMESLIEDKKKSIIRLAELHEVKDEYRITEYERAENQKMLICKV